MNGDHIRKLFLINYFPISHLFDLKAAGSIAIWAYVIPRLLISEDGTFAEFRMSDTISCNMWLLSNDAEIFGKAA